MTYLVGAPAESASASYKIHLYWRGEDPDGYVAGFLWSWDDSTISAFRYTTRTDSVFDLEVNDSLALVVGTGQQQPSQSKNHTFFIRAVDNLGKADPNLARFNRRVFNASTSKPVVRFVGPLPSNLTSAPDTICDHTPFTICWTGSDVDGYVKYYRWDVGVFSKGFSSDTCAVFNDPNDPRSVSLVNGTYTFTVVAADNAFALSDPATGGRTLFLVNHDPETVILGDSGGPLGYYQARFDNGNEVAVSDSGPWIPFHQGDTIPYRSTVYFDWKGFDDACDSPQGIAGFAATLREGTRDGGDPYITGFRDFLCMANGDSVFFTSNAPQAVRTNCGFTALVLDSLDAGRNMLFTVAAKDLSGRSDGTPASFQFNCNRPPTVSDLTVADGPAPNSPRVKVFSFDGRDPEDGPTGEVLYTLDDIKSLSLKATTGQRIQSITIPESDFRALAPSNPHKLEIRVRDRAGFYSDPISVTFDISLLP
ncbi:MAG TPA: hypothetical protein VE326_01360 [Candidatus Binatia bacterium]|nr:hypothetical protein [Candidatus Binatia bacterium]